MVNFTWAGSSNGRGNRLITRGTRFNSWRADSTKASRASVLGYSPLTPHIGSLKITSNQSLQRHPATSLATVLVDDRRTGNVRCLVSAPAHQTAVSAREVTSGDALRVADDADDVQRNIRYENGPHTARSVDAYKPRPHPCIGSHGAPPSRGEAMPYSSIMHSQSIYRPLLRPVGGIRVNAPLKALFRVCVTRFTTSCLDQCNTPRVNHAQRLRGMNGIK